MRSLFLSFCLLLSVFTMFSFAQEATEDDVFWETFFSYAVQGPETIRINSVGEFNLPENMLYFPREAAVMFSEYMGNPASDGLEGLVMSIYDEEGWAGYIEYSDSGYISDADAQNWDKEELLKIYNEGNEEANRQRAEWGVSGIEIAGWAQEPIYDSAKHILVWAMNIKEQGAETSPEDFTINYNTYVLGRSGYFEMSFVTDAVSFEEEKPVADEIISNITFVKGQDYASFDAKTDKDSGLGLKALIVGGGAAAVAKKVGLLAVLAKFSKVIIAGIIAAGAGVFGIFRKKKTSNDSIITR